MTTLLTAALCLAATLPQDPQQAAKPTATQTVELVARAAWLPADSQLALSIAPHARLIEELGPTAAADLFAALRDAPSTATVWRATASWLQQDAGLEPELLLQALAPGWTAAVAPDGAGGTGWVVILEEGEAAAGILAAARRLSPDPADGPLAVGGTPLGTRVHLQDAGGPLIVASSAALARRVHGRVVGTADGVDGLAETEGYRRALRFAVLEESQAPLVALHLAAGRSITHGLAELPAADRREAAAWLERLGLDRVGSCAYLLSTDAARVRERFLVDFPSPRGPLFDALVPAGRRIDPSLANLVPSNATAVTVSHIEPKRVWGAAIDLLEAHRPTLAEQARGMLGMFGNAFGVDIEGQLLPALGGRMVSVAWPTTGGESEHVLLWDVVNADPLRAAFAGMPGIDASRLANHDLYLPETGEGPAYAVHDERAVLASSETALRRWLGARRNGDAHGAVRAGLSQLNGPASSYSWFRFDADAMENLAAGIERLPLSAPAGNADPTDMLAAMRPWLDRIDAVECVVEASDRGFEAVLESGTGVVPGVAGSALALVLDQLASTDQIAQLVERARDRQSAQELRLLTAVRSLSAAQVARAAAGRGAAGADQLIAAGEVPAELFDDLGTDGTARVGGHLVTTLTAGDEAAGAGFAVVAWPAERGRGPLYLDEGRGRVLRNDLIAMVDGLDRPTAADLFVDGTFGGTRSPGWREVENPGDLPPPIATPAAPGVEPARAGSRLIYSTLLELESRGSDAAPELLELLDDDDPLVVARAAHTLGALRHAPATVRLAAHLDDHASVEVRRQAAAALAEIADPRAREALQTALADDDTEVRAWSASALGKIGDARATDKLIAFLSASEPTEPASRPDRTAAILALVDLRASDAIGQAASSVTAPDAQLDQALAFALQELSPGLEPEREAVSLIAMLDHPGALVRRYAVQRLGELGDARATGALERRLGTEGDELRPLIEVSLAALRGPEQAESSAAVALPAWLTDRSILVPAGAGLGALVLGGIVWAMLARRRRQQEDADNWAEMVQPSDEYLAAHTPQELGAYDEDYDTDEESAGYEGDEEYAEQEYADEEYGDEEFTEADATDDEVWLADGDEESGFEEQDDGDWQELPAEDDGYAWSDQDDSQRR